MDTTQDITFRDFVLNDADITDNITGGGYTGAGIGGCVVDQVDFADVDVVQWLEKRSQGDGSDAGDVFLGTRRIRMSGTLYGRTRALLFDQLFDLRRALNPVLAQREEPLDRGYRPLYFSVPTNRVEDYPNAIIELQTFALPRGIQHVDNRDALGGDPGDNLSQPWQTTFVCKDPGIYSRVPVEVDFDATTSVTGTTGDAATNLLTKANHGLVAGDRITFGTHNGGTGIISGVTYYVIASGLTANDFKISTTSGGAALDFTTALTSSTWIKSSTKSGSWSNRGNFLGKFNLLVEVGSGQGSISGTVGDSVFTINVPVSNGNRIIRLKDEKVLTFEEADVESKAMSSIVFTGDTTWPLIDPGVTPYSITFHGMGGVVDGSRMWFYEQYA